ncbi:scavenger receptor cysteine-rich domain-containing protein DMBT1-like isoform 15-T15 [Menidia menidia]
MWTLLVLCTVVAPHGAQGWYWTTDAETVSSPTATGSVCGGYLYGSSDDFYSPNYPNSYPYYSSCVWYIRPGRRYIRLEFSAVNIGCYSDDIRIYDGSSTGHSLLGSYCSSRNTVFYSTGSYLTVHFISDGYVNYSGFRAHYRRVDTGSCENKCGDRVANCSCSSDCTYRGNCCPDYEDYCLSSTQIPDFTAQLSCRYNCGSHLGSCSCTSSCQYYGNCCHDYSSYCPSPTDMTTPDMTTTDQPSCRHNCGYNMGSCSCTSSCRYNGNCCYDYDSYCPSPSPTMPATAQPSCRNNCGYNMGSCSCRSSCRYNGNCCYDYDSYCSTNTTQASGSCRNNCGQHVGSCSCRSSCRYNGNCCYDYDSYCDNTTPPGKCGDFLFGSGTFSSPNHPGYYSDNAYCVWQLRAVHDQRIFLSFKFLQLDKCCSCDYIAIYDGPSNHSGSLGKVCNNSLTTFYSSSNYMTVVFRSDSSVVARGFSAEFMSTLKPSSGQVDCSSGNMNIVIERSYLNSLGYDGHSLYLNDPQCRPQISSSQVVFRFPLNTCGNIRQDYNGRIVHTNNVRAYASSYGEITRQSHFKLNVTCLMEPDSVSQIMFVVKNNGNSSITGSGRYQTGMAFYTSSSFNYKVTQVPYEVGLNQNLYVQVDLGRRDSSLIVFLHTCVASPSPFSSNFTSRLYYLVRDGCEVDNTYWPISSGTQSLARFSFRAFQFLRATDSVYIQCRVLICPASQAGSRCRRGCSRRAARDLGSEHDDQTLVVGPIKLKEPEKKEEVKEKKEV